MLEALGLANATRPSRPISLTGPRGEGWVPPDTSYAHASCPAVIIPKSQDDRSFTACRGPASTMSAKYAPIDRYRKEKIKEGLVSAPSGWGHDHIAGWGS